MSQATAPDGETSGAPRIRLRGIVKSFGSVEALRGVDLDLWPGECLGLVGDNAAGKSTLTKVISGTYLADAGSIEMDGAPLHLKGPADARGAGIEMVFQDLSLCESSGFGREIDILDPRARFCDILNPVAQIGYSGLQPVL